MSPRRDHLAHRATPQRPGLLLVAMLLALTLLGLAVIGIVVAGGQLSDVDRRRLDAFRAEYNADAAAALAIREIASNTDHDSDGTTGGVSDDANPATGPLLNGHRVNADASVAGNATTVAMSDVISQARRPVRLNLQRPASTGIFPGLYVEGWKINGWVSIASSQSAGTFNTTPRWRSWMIDPFMSNRGNGDVLFVGQPTDGYTVRFTGFITIPQTGSWTFGTNTDDGSTVWINGQQVVANDFGQAPTFRSGSAVTLSAGTYSFVMHFWDGGGGHALHVQWNGPGTNGWQIIPAAAFTCNLPTDTRLPRFAMQSEVLLFGDGHPSNAVLLQAWYGQQAAFAAGLEQTGMAHASVNLNQASRIRFSNLIQQGMLLSAPGTTPSSVIEQQGSATFDGRGTLPSLAVAMINRPRNIPATSADRSLSGTTTETWSSSFRVNNLNLFNQSQVQIQGDISVFVDNSMQLTDTSRIHIPAGSRLRLYLANTLSVNNSAIINTDGIPGRLLVFSTGSGSIQLSTNAQLHGFVFAPNASVLIYNNSRLSGGVFANRLEAYGTSRLMADLGSATSATGSLRITGWTNP